MLGKPKILFLCTGHPERSEMAEGFTRALAPGSVEPVSAAVEAVPVDPLAVHAMKEVGIDISAQEAADVKTVLQQRFAYVVGVGDQSKERCPVFPFAFRLIQWSVEDPREVAGSTECRMDAFRRVRNQIAPRVRELLALAQSDQLRPSLAR